MSEPGLQEIREAASVILLRDGPDGPETWLMRRMVSMVFAAGMCVFPGGKVDPDDAVTGSRIPEADLQGIAAQLSTTIERAGQLVCAAARETFEEVGVLLADRPVFVAPELRAAVEDRERAFSDVLSELGAAPDVAAIRPWSRWITPDGEPRRFDTYFFVAAVPEGSTAASLTGEASHAEWVAVHRAISEVQSGDRPMLPPTMSNLSDVAQFDTVAEVLAEAALRRPDPVRPSIEWSDDGHLQIATPDGRTFLMSPAATALFPGRLPNP